jgi:hypothetical protein
VASGGPVREIKAVQTMATGMSEASALARLSPVAIDFASVSSQIVRMLRISTACAAGAGA